jgi:hypothetical protein
LGSLRSFYTTISYLLAQRWIPLGQLLQDHFLPAGTALDSCLGSLRSIYMSISYLLA